MAKKIRNIKVGGRATTSRSVAEAFRFGRGSEVARLQRALQSQVVPVDTFMRAMTRKWDNR
ncbi:hypothetical protein [Rhizobium sp. 2MFCol3.1]|uniref:hypothetical protein n=1 Tax=Rhizobium sp. 2MFCol3.1 TaxID=1246459 RepID=UPI00037F1DD5|nr:hypothetical protein [Rhizobium sp. 2MFCol3.1]